MPPPQKKMNLLQNMVSTYVFHDKISRILTMWHGEHSLALGKVHKRFKRAKKALVASQDPKKSTQRAKIPYPTGETPGRGDFNLADFLFEHSEVSKEDYNAFIVRSPPQYQPCCPLTPFLTLVGSDPQVVGSCRYPHHLSLAQCPNEPTFGGS